MAGVDRRGRDTLDDAQRLKMVRGYLEAAYELLRDMPHTEEVRVHMGDMVDDLVFIGELLKHEAKPT